MKILGLYVIGSAVVGLYRLVINIDRHYKHYDAYLENRTDEAAYLLVSTISKDLFDVVLWPVSLVRYFLLDLRKPTMKLIQASIRHSAKIKQHALDDKSSIRGGLSVTDKE